MDLWMTITDAGRDALDLESRDCITTGLLNLPLHDHFSRITCDPSMVPFVLRPRSRSHMPLSLRPETTSAYRVQARWIIWTAFSVADACSLYMSRLRHHTFSGEPTPPPFSTTGKAAPSRCRVGRIQDPDDLSTTHSCSTWFAPIFHTFAVCRQSPTTGQSEDTRLPLLRKSRN